MEGKLRDLLQWGLAAPGGRGATHRTETFLTTALLGKQGEVSAIFEASLKGDQDDSGRTLVTRALDALGQDPLVTKLLDRLKDRTGEVYTPSGRHRRSWTRRSSAHSLNCESARSAFEPWRKRRGRVRRSSKK